LAVIEDYVDSLRDLDGLVMNSGFIDGGYDSSIRLSRSVFVLTGCGLGIVDGRYGGFYGVFWLAKEYHSSVLSRYLGYQWISDLALLTEGLSMSSSIYVPVHRVVGRDEGFKLHDVAKDFPEEYASWDLVYFKVHRYSPVLCLTYPSAHRDLLECALGTLYTLSHGKGYPEPMIIVHSKSTVSRGIAGLIADKLYEKSGDVSLAKTARDAMGLR